MTEILRAAALADGMVAVLAGTTLSTRNSTMLIASARSNTVI